jgi:hypothetical protein
MLKYILPILLLLLFLYYYEQLPILVSFMHTIGQQIDRMRD